MAEKKKQNGKASGSKSQDASSTARNQGDDQGRTSAGQAFAGRADQLGTIVSKGLDLAEAGLSLGLSVVNQVGAVAQQTILERASQEETSPAPPPSPTPQSQPAQDEQSYWLTNRLPLLPGGPVKVSFSINNDSMIAPKQLKIRAEGFVGEAEGKQLEPEGFTVKPGRKTIAPMDFEKFVLQGAVPPETVPDVYQGEIVVESDEEMRIPIRLAVMSP